MEETIHIDIINKEVLDVLKGLEVQQLIRLHKDTDRPIASTNWAAKYKGAMAQRPLQETNEQLSNLRNAWA